MSVLAVGFTACNKDDEKIKSSTELSPAEAKVQTQKMDNDLSKDIVEMFNAEGMNAIFSLSDLMTSGGFFNGRTGQPVKDHKEILKFKAKEFRRIFVPSRSVAFGKTTGDGGFNFQENLGVYVWNSSTESFDKTNEIVESIIIKYPLKNSDTNNVILILSKYEEIELTSTDDSGTSGYLYYLPTKIVAEIKVNNVKQVGLNFEATYKSQGTPDNANVSLFINPFTYNLAVNNTGTKSIKVIASIKKSTTLIFDALYNFHFEDTEKSILDETEGYVAFREFKLQGTVDVKGMRGLNESADINPFVSMVLHKAGSKVGDIVFVYESVNEMGISYSTHVPYLKYSDGSKEKLETVFASTFEEIESYLLEFEGV
ncbi:hypothetical protein BH23BAC1_BH23BAC1_33950 [soil metagenome]